MRFLALSSFVTLASVTGALASNDSLYDYIVVGGGPSGIITAERLSAANKKVLLLERGHGPTVATGSNYTVEWNDTLTPIDVPGLSTAIGGLPLWEDYICPDTPSASACVLGGGVTVNYMVFVHPPERDFDESWPTGWKWNDVAPAAERLYSRNPGSTLPSEDGQRYDQGLFKTMSGFLGKLGWKHVDMSEQPNEKHEVYSYPTWNIKDAERAGPVRTYLPLARQRKNFTLRMGTKVSRVVRSGSRATGVEMEAADGGREIIRLARGGRVVLSSGAMSTPRLLFSSGIGPRKQILTAKKTGVTLPPENDWINLPVGKHLKDHPIFSIVINTGGSYAPVDTDKVLNGSDTSDINLYDSSSSGVLSQGKHRIIFYTSMKGSDGVTRFFQGSCAPSDDGVVTITAYMTHGLTSTGVLGMAENGSAIFEQSPYLQTDGDKKAATAFIQDMLRNIATEPSFKLQTYTNTTAILGSLTNGIHYAGTAKIGTDDGRKGGSSVVDTNTKVYGMDNLFIVDASIHPDVASGNNQATVMIVAEAAVAKILACE